MTKQSERHVPVLLKDAIEFLHVRAGSTVMDCTLGLAGHAAEIVWRLGPAGRLIGFDRDPEALRWRKEPDWIRFAQNWAKPGARYRR